MDDGRDYSVCVREIGAVVFIGVISRYSAGHRIPTGSRLSKGACWPRPPSPPPYHKSRKPLHPPGCQLPDGRARRAAFIGHAAGEQAAHRVEAAERMGDETNFVLIKTIFV